MLNQLDTLIGFVVVMALVSLLVTIFTQMISGLAGLRGWCLADALEAMVYKIDPSIKEQCRDLVDRMLTHPMASDSILPMNQHYPIPVLGWIPGLKKWNPSFWQRIVLRWRRATAIRPEEILALLELHAGCKATEALAALDQSYKAYLDAKEKWDEWKKQAQPNPKPAQADEGKNLSEKMAGALRKYTALRILSKLHDVSDEARAVVEALRIALPKLIEQRGAAAIQEISVATNHALNNLTQWFEATQDRASQWFTMHTRRVTVVLAFVLAFVLQLDTIELVKQVSSDKTLRDNLVKTAVDGSLMNAGTAVFNNGTNLTMIGTNTLMYQEKMAVLTNALNTVVQTSAKDGLILLPEPYPIHFCGWHWPFFKLTGLWSWPARHLFGIIISACLLSLGAPFWFNLLKSLANLRTSLANEVDKDAQQPKAQTKST